MVDVVLFTVTFTETFQPRPTPPACLTLSTYRLRLAATRTYTLSLGALARARARTRGGRIMILHEGCRGKQIFAGKRPKWIRINDDGRRFVTKTPGSTFGGPNRNLFVPVE